MANRIQIALSAAVLVAGLFFLPVWAFTCLSAIVALALPAARWPREYRLLPRVIVALVFGSVAFLSSRGVQVAVEGGLPLPIGQLVPPLGLACEQSRWLLSGFLPMAESPACRLLLQDPHGEYGFGFFLELLQVINLVWIRLWNLQPSLRKSDARAEGFSAVWLFAFFIVALSYLAQLWDSMLAPSADKPFALPVAYLFAAFYIFFVSVLQLRLYPMRQRAIGG